MKARIVVPEITFSLFQGEEVPVWRRGTLIIDEKHVTLLYGGSRLAVRLGSITGVELAREDDEAELLLEYVDGGEPEELVVLASGSLSDVLSSLGGGSAGET